MINNLLKSNSYKELSSKQVKEIIKYLQFNNMHLNLTANLSCVEFNPKLPINIYNKLTKFTLFTLANFTFSSLKIKDNYIEFEAGFGIENFGSVCSIPYHGVFQIGMSDSIIFLNPIATIQDCKKDNDENTQKQRSMNAFKLNNQK
jgi:hypothetical protein